MEWLELLVLQNGMTPLAELVLQNGMTPLADSIWILFLYKYGKDALGFQFLSYKKNTALMLFFQISEVFCKDVKCFARNNLYWDIQKFVSFVSHIVKVRYPSILNQTFENFFICFRSRFFISKFNLHIEYLSTIKYF